MMPQIDMQMQKEAILINDQTQKKLLEKYNLNSHIEKIVIIPENIFPLFKGT